MDPLKKYTEQYCAYWGDRQDWLVAGTQNRDSCAMVRSNWRVALKELGGEGEQVAVEQMGHWACGWIEYLLIDPAAGDKITLAEQIIARLEDYPLLDEDDFYELENEEFYEFAKSQLEQFEGWAEVFQEECEKSNSGAGDQTAEWEIIEAARARLEARDEEAGDAGQP